LLLMGQRAVFDNIAWVIEAYDDVGICELFRLFRQNQLPIDLYNAFKDIDEGSHGNVAKLWHGNIAIAHYEQKKILQPMYDAIREHFTPDDDDVFMMFVNVLGNMNAGAMNPLTGARGLPKGYDITDFDDRWKWMTQNVLPIWQGWAQEQRDKAVFGFPSEPGGLP